MIRSLFISFILLFFTVASSAQSFKKLVKTGEKYYEEGYYQEAINTFLEAQELDPNDMDLTLKIGLAYLKGSFKDRALPYLQKVHASGETNAGMKYHLGLAYQYNHQFEKTLEFFNIYREEAENTFTVDQHIKQCNIGIEYYNNPKEVKASNIKAINSEYQDYAPLITADGNTLIFTSRRKGRPVARWRTTIITTKTFMSLIAKTISGHVPYRSVKISTPSITSVRRLFPLMALNCLSILMKGRAIFPTRPLTVTSGQNPRP